MMEKKPKKYIRNIKKGIIYSSIIILILVVLGGCAGLFPGKDIELLREGKFNELAEYYESHPELESQGLCMSYLKIRHYDKLFSCLKKMEETYKAEGKNINYDAFLAMRGQAYLELGQYAKAIKDLEKALSLYKAEQAGTFSKIEYESSLILAYILNNDNEKAKALSKKAIKGLQRIKSLLSRLSGEAVAASFILTMARPYMALKDYNSVYRIIKEEYPTQKFPYKMNLDFLFGIFDISFDLTFFTMELHFMFAKAAYEIGKIEEARSEYLKLLENPQIQDSSEIHTLALHDLGKIYHKDGQIDKAINEFFAKAIDLIEIQRASIHSEVSKIGFVGDKQAVYKDIISALFEKKDFSRAFEYVERSKSRALVDMLASQQNISSKKLGAQGTKTLLSQLEESQSQLLAIRYLPDETPSEKQRDIRLIKDKLQSVDAEFSSLVSVNAINTRDTQYSLKKRETLVEYYYHDDIFYVFVVVPNKIKGFKLNISGLEDDIKAFRKALQLSDSSNYKSISQKLHSRLIQPINSMLSTNSIIIVPHGILHYLPFCALSSESQYLIDQYSIRILPSATVMNFLTDSQEKQTKLLAFGNPDLKKPEYDLSGAQEEVKAISNIIPESKILLREEATETAFKKLSNQFNQFHFASHGFFDPENPLKSGLVLAKDAHNDGFLTTSELYTLN